MQRKKYKFIFIFILTLIILSSLSIILFFFYNRCMLIKREDIINNTTNDSILEIPKINLREKLFDLNDQNNNIDKNLYVSPLSSKDNIIIIGHSGNMWNSFFKDLHKLENNDLVYLYTKEKIYTYKVYNKYYLDKNKNFEYKNKYSNELTLITCTSHKNTYTIYNLYLIN